MKKYAYHMGRRVLISENRRSGQKKANGLSVDEMTKHVANKFPSYSVKLKTSDCEFAVGVRIREVVLFVRKLARRRK